eukprot:2270630-Rhodomonas_salina.2
MNLTAKRCTDVCLGTSHYVCWNVMTSVCKQSCLGANADDATCVTDIKPQNNSCRGCKVWD